jgi:hypothetical protein
MTPAAATLACFWGPPTAVTLMGHQQKLTRTIAAAALKKNNEKQSIRTGR